MYMPRQLRIQVLLCTQVSVLNRSPSAAQWHFFTSLFSKHLKASLLFLKLWPCLNNLCLPPLSLWLWVLYHKVEAFSFWAAELTIHGIYSSICEVLAAPVFPPITVQEASFPRYFLELSGPYTWLLSQELLIYPVSYTCLWPLNFSF